jgi:UDP-2-acetamido-3-amino-2,3-dideoxy-glucuronate N-acetyltransferase
VRQGATLATNCTIAYGVTIGKYAFIGAGSVVNKDVPEYALMVGVSVRHIGWMSKFGEQLELPLKGVAARCSRTGMVNYLLNDQIKTIK